MCTVPYVPVIVAKRSFLSQTANISTTTVFTPSEDGDYEIATYITQDSSNPGGGSISVTWTDEYGTFTQGWGGINPGTSGYAQDTVHATSGNPIQIAVSGPTSNPYDVFVTITKK